MVASPDPRREDMMRGAQITGWGLSLRTRSSPTPTSRHVSTRVTNGSSSGPGSKSGATVGRLQGSPSNPPGAPWSGRTPRPGDRPSRARDHQPRPNRPRNPRRGSPPARCRGAAFDLNAACAGFVYGLVTAVALLDAGHERALVIGSDTLSQITDQNDRNTAVLFGDGSGAVVSRPPRANR